MKKGPGYTRVRRPFDIYLPPGIRYWRSHTGHFMDIPATMEIHPDAFAARHSKYRDRIELFKSRIEKARGQEKSKILDEYSSFCQIRHLIDPLECIGKIIRCFILEKAKLKGRHLADQIEENLGGLVTEPSTIARELVTNALAHAHNYGKSSRFRREPVRLMFRMFDDVDSIPHLEVRVRDMGPGIPRSKWYAVDRQIEQDKAILAEIEQLEEKEKELNRTLSELRTSPKNNEKLSQVERELNKTRKLLEEKKYKSFLDSWGSPGVTGTEVGSGRGLYLAKKLAVVSQSNMLYPEPNTTDHDFTHEVWAHFPLLKRKDQAAFF